MSLPTDPMSCEDRQHLLKIGFKEAMIEELDRRHFKPCRLPKDTLPPSKVPRYGFLRQTTLPHLHIALTIHDTPESLDTAIYDAGRRDGHDLLGMFFMRFFDAVKNRPAAGETTSGPSFQIDPFYEKGLYRGWSCTCGFTSSTGDFAADRKLAQQHTCTPPA